jgi:hypothetical protein
MIEDSAEEFLTVLSREGSLGLAPPRIHDTGGLARSHHNHMMDGECSDHTGHDDGSPTDGCATTRNQTPLPPTK